MNNLKNILIPILSIIIFASCKKENITISKDAHDTFFLKTEGASIPIQVHGNTASGKFIVLVHGGPGGGSIAYRPKFEKQGVEKDFAVVYWDQRIAGSSQGNANNDSIASFRDDVKKVLLLVKARYGVTNKLYLLGHSWGGFLTPYFLEEANNQSMIQGWIQVDGAHNYALNDSLAKEMLLLYGKDEIANNRNVDRWTPIINYCNAHAFNESYDVGGQLNSYANSVEGLIEKINKVPKQSIFTNFTANYFPLTSQLGNILSSSTFLKIDKQAYTAPISENLFKINVPTLLLWGRHDFVCPIGLADDIKKHIGSTDLTQIVFEHSGHSPMNNEPELFCKALIDWVRVH
jgi:pimeloyl-ACP methyl ester carboxylesterase